MNTLGTAGDVEIYGAEAEITWQLTPELLVYTGVSLMDADIKNGDYEDQTPAHAPDFTINGLVSYTASQAIGGSGLLPSSITAIPMRTSLSCRTTRAPCRIPIRC